MKPIQYKITQAQQVEGIIPHTIREFRGLNAFDAMAIDESYFTEVSNLDSSDFPASKVRPGYTVLGKFGTKILGLATWKGIELHAVFNDGTWRKWNGASWVTLKSGLNIWEMWSFTNFQGSWAEINLVGCNGVNGLHRYDGTSVQTFGDAPANINFITTYQNRLWGASGKELLACALDKPEQWKTFVGNEEDSYGKEIESSQGENISMLTGGMSKLTIGLPNSIKELYGGMPSDFFDRLVTEDAGVVNNQSAVTYNGQLTFMHRSGIYEYSGGTLPTSEFSKVIGRFPMTASFAAAGTDGEKIYYQADSALLVYDTRQGVQTWYVWNGIQATCFTTYLGMLVIGDRSGQVIMLNNNSDGGTPINWHAVTKPFNNMSLAQRTRWYKLWLVAEIAAGSNLQVHLSKSASGNSDWELVQSVSGNGLGVQKVLVPVGKYALENWVRVKISGAGQAKLYELTRQTRPMPM